ncbi:uncharacterized protein LOC110900805 [Helianthus annuus]|uniref:uncharacterized protein LOC110900805 n=1 Tax=Helianthus annuus TaxID=4232 RepID=UPI000B8F8428|nr:uncharacterized protein LOC110900805 [Helianthus annuus]
MSKPDASSDSTSKPDPLHPAYSVTNIQSKIRTLDGSKVTYTAWVNLFKLHVLAYKVSNHINGTAAPATTDPTYNVWHELDALVLQWILSTISDDLLPRVMDSDGTARDAWKLKELANQLVDVDHSITESRLVLQLVRGLPAEFDTTASLINSSNEDWDLALSMRNDEAIRVEGCQKATTSVLAAPTTQPQPPTTQQLTPQNPSYGGQQPFLGRGRGHGNFN